MKAPDKVNRNISISVPFLTLLWSIGYSVDGVNAVTHSATGNEFVREVGKNGYHIELIQIVDDEYEKVVPLENSKYLCRFSSKAELSLIPNKRGFDKISCRLNVFKKADNLSVGWKIVRMHWMGDLDQANFIVDPRDSRRPHFSVELQYEKPIEKKADATRLRLNVVSLMGPPEAGRWPLALRE